MATVGDGAGVDVGLTRVAVGTAVVGAAVGTAAVGIAVGADVGTWLGAGDGGARAAVGVKGTGVTVEGTEVVVAGMITTTGVAAGKV